MRFSYEQELGVFSSTSNILVSAGAGSGKTAVMTGRIIEMFKKGVKPEELLILTFTNEAALELKKRIKKEVLKDLSIKNLYLEIDSADVGTFDSFALELVKKYHYVLNINKDVSIILGPMLSIEKRRIMEDIFFTRIENDSFKKLLGDYTDKDYKGLLETILKLSADIDIYYDRNSYLNNYFDNYSNEEVYKKMIENYRGLLDTKGKELHNWATKRCSYFPNTIHEAKYNELINFLSFNHSYDEYKAFFDNYNAPSPKMNSNDKDDDYDFIKDSFNNCLKEMRELLNYASENEIFNCFKDSRANLKEIIDILKDFYQRIDKYKLDNNCFEFSDIARFAFKIIEDNADIREEYRHKYKEILVDEYQDTSSNQEAFINLIANDNVYQVGDIKQSIYRFRNANPYNFKRKYNEYTYIPNKEPGYKIDLTNNFRSRKEVLEDINKIFSSIMTNEVGDADYVNYHQMKYGNTKYDENKVEGYDYHAKRLIYTYDKEEKRKAEDLSKIEILMIAKKIKELMASMEIFDKELGAMRNICYSDIAIIPKTNSNFDLYCEILNQNGIPYDVVINDKIGKNAFFNDMASLLNLIRTVKSNDEKYAYYFLSVARSFLLSISDDELLSYHFDNYKDNALYHKALAIKEYALSNSPSKTFEHILKEFNVYDKMMLIGDKKENIALLDFIIDTIGTLANLGHNFDDIAVFFEQSLEDKVEVEIKKTSKHIGVQILNIFQSKGLEYPICFFPDLNRSFNKTDINNKFIFNHDYGIIVPYKKDDVIENNIDKKLFANKAEAELLSEQLRILYVAITRAKEQFYLVETINSDEKEPADIKKSRSFADFLSFAYQNPQFNPGIEKYDSANLAELGYTAYKGAKKKINFNELTKYQEEIKFDEKDFLPKEVEKAKISKEFLKLKTEDNQKLLDLGTHLHEILEMIDLKTKDYSALNLTIDEKTIIDKVLNLDIFKDLKDANIYQEHEFYFEDDNESYHGIIDLLIEKKDKFIIIDYKLFNTDKEEYIRQLSVYKHYLETIENKEIKVYLLSLLKAELVEVNL